MEDWIKAGKIAAEVLAKGASKIKTGKLLIGVSEFVEDEIIKAGAKPAFPAQISMDEIAAHYNPFVDDKTEFKDGDLVKLDVGVSVNGCIGDTACTVDLGDNNDLVEASKKALNEAIKVVEIGTKLWEIGEAIETAIKEFGFNPIRNLSGHEIKPYKVHSGLNIPNYNNQNNFELKEGMIIAIEPFATTGDGLIKEGRLSEIYGLVNQRNVRDPISRKVLQFISNEYKTLPFAKRWLVKKFKLSEVNFALRILEKEKVLHQYTQLPEISNGLVSQAEHTLSIQDKVKILTKRED